MTELYTVLNRAGEIVAVHVDVNEAAREILRYDSAQFVVEAADDGGWQLFTKSMNGKWDLCHPTARSYAVDKEAATNEMFKDVVLLADADGWGAEAIGDDVYRADLEAMIADLDVDDEERDGLQEMLDDWLAA